MQALLITIGDELLIGQTIDTNSAWMGKELNKIGVWVKERIAISDDKAHIIKTIDYAISQADVVLITGGLGPTKDDITKHTLCEYFGGKLISNAKVLQHVTDIFTRRNLPILERNTQQALVPDNCEVLFNESGTAPGMLFRKGNVIIVSMPGVPYEMQHIMITHVLPMLKSLSDEKVLHETIITAGVGESFLADKIKDWEDALPPFLKLAYLPAPGMVKLRLTARGKNTADLETPLQKEMAALKFLVQNHLIAEHDEPLEKTIGSILKERKQTMAVAESCTGGYIGSKITSIAGSSEYFLGGIICYSYSSKVQLLGVDKMILETKGAVSEEVVSMMCSGCLKTFNSDYAVAVSGIAGPDGGTTDKPVGTVWIAVGSKEKVVAKKFLFTKNRNTNIEYTYANAINMLMELMKSNS